MPNSEKKPTKEKKSTLDSGVFTRAYESLTRISHLNVQDIWDKRFYIYVRMLIEAYRQLVKDNCLVRANALGYKTLISLIPLLVVFLMILSVLFAGQKKQKEEIVDSAVSLFFPSEIKRKDNQVKKTSETAITKSEGGNAFLSSELDMTLGPKQIPDLKKPLIELQKEFKADQVGSTSMLNKSNAAQLLISQNIGKLFELAENINKYKGSLGIIGILFLFWTTLSLVFEVENNLNQIWNVKKGSGFFRRLPYYFLLLCVAPFVIMLLSAIGLKAGETSWVIAFSAWEPFGLGVGAFIFNIVQQLLFILVGGLFFGLCFSGFPNTKVNFKSAFVGGLVASVLFAMVKGGFIYYLEFFTKGNLALYGSLIAIPIFILLLYVLWLIFLLGAEVAYTHQNLKKLIFHHGRHNRNQAPTLYLGTRLYTEVCRFFIQGAQPPNLNYFIENYNIPEEEIRDIISKFEKANLLSQVESENNSGGYLPAQDIETVTLQQVIGALQTESFLVPPLVNDDYRNIISPVFNKITQFNNETLREISLKTLGEQSLQQLETNTYRPALKVETDLDNSL